MNSYQILWKKSAVKDLQKLPPEIARNIFALVSALADEPRPHNCKKLISLANHYRMRVGDYRVVYRIEDEILVIEIIRIGHRKDVYR
jgi:mRNA interferase RelE/StbE